MSAKTTILHENGTDDELYPVTKASVTYRNDGTTTVEGTLTDYDTLETKFGDTSATLPTTAQTVVGAIAEHENDISTLNGNLTDTFVIKRYTAQKSITPSAVYITASEFGASTPTGYTPIAIVDFSQNLGVIHVRAISVTASGGQGMMWFGNPNGKTVTVDATVSILYVKTALL